MSLTKEQFEIGWVLVRVNDSYLGEMKERVQIKDLYADFKQRLIDELRTEDFKVGGQTSFYRLIDTTDK